MVSRCFPGGYNVKLYISRGRLAWWLLTFLCCVTSWRCVPTTTLYWYFLTLGISLLSYVVIKYLPFMKNCCREAPFLLVPLPAKMVWHLPLFPSQSKVLQLEFGKICHEVQIWMHIELMTDHFVTNYGSQLICISKLQFKYDLELCKW